MNETTIGKRPRRMRSAAERANWVALFERSGKGVKTFCRENELTPSGLFYDRSSNCSDGLSVYKAWSSKG